MPRFPVFIYPEIRSNTVILIIIMKTYNKNNLPLFSHDKAEVQEWMKWVNK